jgi:ubiquitin-protein ligase
VQRLRFCLWGQSVGLVPNPSSGLKRQYDQALDQPDIRPNIERILFNIKTLLDDASKVDKKYGEEPTPSQDLCVPSNSKGLDIFKGTFERFRGRVQKHQQDASPWKVATWAINDAKKFEEIINRLEKFVDGLENITKSLQSLTDLHAQLQEEVEDISDAQSLKLLRDASSRSSSNVPSGSSSRRLINDVAESVLEQRTVATQSIGSGISFVTASAGRLTIKESLQSADIRIPGAYPDSVKSKSLFHVTKFPRRSNAEVITTNGKDKSKDADLNCPDHANNGDGFPTLEATSHDLQTQDVPQNQRLLRELLENAKPRKPLSFTAGDVNYGQHLSSVKLEDEEFWHANSARLLTHAEASSSAAKRMFLELRDIRTGKIPFISAVPLGDSLDKVLASIEGPPETPYEGGVFWITVQLHPDSHKPPLLRFQTKIYHPNISPQGHICADYKELWSLVQTGDAKNKWYQRRKGDISWSLGALLTALCGLLAAPDVDDPLVPEIAQTYLRDHEAYCQAAKNYTTHYAIKQRPEASALVFMEAPEESSASVYEPPSPKEKAADTVSMQKINEGLMTPAKRLLNLGIEDYINEPFAEVAWPEPLTPWSSYQKVEAKPVLDDRKLFDHTFDYREDRRSPPISYMTCFDEVEESKDPGVHEAYLLQNLTLFDTSPIAPANATGH